MDLYDDKALFFLVVGEVIIIQGLAPALGRVCSLFSVSLVMARSTTSLSRGSTAIVLF